MAGPCSEPARRRRPPRRTKSIVVRASYFLPFVGGAFSLVDAEQRVPAAWAARRELQGQHTCDGYDEEWGHCPDLPECVKCSPIDCEFSSWGDWYLGGGCMGLRFRQRSIRVANNECGTPCQGAKIMSEVLLLPKCLKEVKDCAFCAWSEWTSCASPFDQSVRSRSVEQQPSKDGRPCVGGIKETRACGAGPEAVSCQLAPWREWTACSSTCGEGRHTRMRRIEVEAAHGGETCTDVLLETAPCSLDPCPSRPCRVSEWSEWSFCDSARGQRYRHRDVLDGPLNGGEACPSDLAETQACPAPDPVDCSLTEWTAWSECDKTCEGGQSYRERQLVEPNHDGGICSLQCLRETQACNTGPCWTSEPNDCVLGEWSAWSECSAKCGKGAVTRQREVVSLAARRGQGCEGSLQEIAPCLVHHCNMVDCQWSEWDDWSACSCSCGGGTQRRNRVVAVSPRNGGQLCEPRDKSEVGPCNTQSCDRACVDGQWGNWMHWSGCSATCSSGFRSRRRDVEVEPNSCGQPVSGLREEFAVCSDLPPCIQDRDCQLSDWGQWSHCSCHCFGIRERNRYIAAFASGNGRPCADQSLKVIEPCNPGPDESVSPECGNKPAEDCALSEWSSWTACTAQCGGGQTERSRTIQTPPANGGKACEDVLVLTAPCNTHPCHQVECQDCEWGAWSSWGDCTKCGGQKFRHRAIQKLPNHCGRPCEAKSAKEVTNCTSTCEQVLYCSWTEWSDSMGCNAECGSSTTMRNRLMTLSKVPVDDFIFAGPGTTRCAGTQLNVSECPFVKSCTPECVPKPCRFGAWSEWHEPTCVGLCERHRVVSEMNNECGEPCSGPLLETKRCPTSCQTPKDCILAEWEGWSECSADPDAGPGQQRYRSRQIAQLPEHGGEPCVGTLRETEGCSRLAPEPCIFSEWASWTCCSKSCGSGWRSRTRGIQAEARDGGEQCQGVMKEIDQCEGKNPACYNATVVDCRFGPWGSWSGCGGDGQKYRDRKVSQIAENGGSPCEGPVHETEMCREPKVDCVISQWTEWDICDRTCGGGQTHRQRQVHRFPEHGGATCPRELIQTQGCNTVPCSSQDCLVGQWSDWSLCSASCGVGLQQRQRFVVSLRSPGGSGADLPLGETRACPDNPSCGAVDCEWGDWTEWSGCSCSCGGGQRTRNIHIRRSPRNGGKPCPEHEKEQIEPCNTHKCGDDQCIDGEFGDWDSWGACTASCGGGVSCRHRKIIRMANECGKEAEGKTMETKFCNVDVSCEQPVDCTLTSWGDWSDCSTTCNGIKRRSRRVEKFGRGDGVWCKGALKETWPCNPSPDESPPEGCSAGPRIDCVLSEWQEWSECTATCGGGQHTRSRVIVQHPANGGAACDAALSEVKECGRCKCSGPPPADCQFGAWQDWGACQKCNGERLRYRNIIQYPTNGGKNCDPFDAEEAGQCPRKCHERQFCTWNSWDEWSGCTATCGTGGKRHRRRSLHLTSDPAAQEPAGVDELMNKYDDLFRRTQELEGRQTPELLCAFGAGAAALIVGLTAIRGFAGHRGAERLGRAGASRTLSRSPAHLGGLGFSRDRSSVQRYAPLQTLRETEMPLMESEAEGEVAVDFDSDLQ